MIHIKFSVLNTLGYISSIKSQKLNLSENEIVYSIKEILNISREESQNLVNQYWNN